MAKANYVIEVLEFITEKEGYIGYMKGKFLIDIIHICVL